MFGKRDEACLARTPSGGKTGPDVLGKNASKRVSRPQECMRVACRAGARARLFPAPRMEAFGHEGDMTLDPDIELYTQRPPPRGGAAENTPPTCSVLGAERPVAAGAKFGPGEGAGQSAPSHTPSRTGTPSWCAVAGARRDAVHPKTRAGPFKRQ